MSNIITSTHRATSKIIAFILIFPLISCSTPTYVLENKNGDIVRCGGTATGSMVGGMIGYEIQKSNDKKCAHDYITNGYKLQGRDHI